MTIQKWQDIKGMENSTDIVFINNRGYIGTYGIDAKITSMVLGIALSGMNIGEMHQNFEIRTPFVDFLEYKKDEFFKKMINAGYIIKERLI